MNVVRGRAPTTFGSALVIEQNVHWACTFPRTFHTMAQLAHIRACGHDTMRGQRPSALQQQQQHGVFTHTSTIFNTRYLKGG